MEKSSQKRIVHCEKHYVTRVALHNIVEEHFPGIEYRSVSTISQLNQLLENGCVPMIILDTTVLDGEGEKIILTLRRRCENINILIFSDLPELIFAKYYLQLGVRGYLSKECAYPEIIEAISIMLKGEIYLSRRLNNHILSISMTPQVALSPFERFSKIELTLIEMLLRHYSLKSISEKFGMKQSTINKHKRNIFSKLVATGVSDLFSRLAVY